MKIKIVPNNQKLHSYYTGEIGNMIQCVACANRLYYEQTYIQLNYCPGCGAIITKIEEIEDGNDNR